jgi:O-methyltransferase domain/Dimerisation domain
MAPDHILELGFAFRKSKALLSAVELGVFTVLGDGPLSESALAGRLGIHPRGARDFFDTLVSLELLERDAVGRYANAADCALYLDARQPDYLGGLFDYLNKRMFPAWLGLTAALGTGTPQAGPAAAGGFDSFYSDGPVADAFLRGMTGASHLVGQALAANFPWDDYNTFVDIGTAQGCVPVVLARAHPHLRGWGFDLPSVERAFTAYVSEYRMDQRVGFHTGDFFRDPLPPADVLIMGRVLHDWDVPRRKMLLGKAYAALPLGGALIVHDALIDDARRDRPHSMLASLNMLIQTSGGSEYTAGECTSWMHDAGFTQTRIIPLAVMQTAVVGVKA